MLLDHFNPPLSQSRHWESFHHQWACNLAADLNSRLPPGWFAEPNIHFNIEIDVAVMDQSAALSSADEGDVPQSALWAPPEPTLTIDYPFATDIVEVRVFRDQAGPELAAAIELVSPANKDRPATREAFVAKCAGFLQDAIGLVIVDVVTSRRANLHVELLERADQADDHWAEHLLYTSAYGATATDDHLQLEVWFEPLRIAAALPSMPLCLKSGPRVQVDLAGTYQLSCEHLKIATGDE